MGTLESHIFKQWAPTIELSVVQQLVPKMRVASLCLRTTGLKQADREMDGRTDGQAACP
jgi:hypothetical protein